MGSEAMRVGSRVIYTDDNNMEHVAEVGAIAVQSDDVMVSYTVQRVEWVKAETLRIPDRRKE